MPEFAKNCKCTTIPGMYYRNATKAIEWLCDVFGFEKHAVHANSKGTVFHAELTFGNGMIMLGSLRQRSGTSMKHPDEVAMASTRSVNLIASHPDTIYERAKAAGAEIVDKIEDKPYGGRGFSCHDLEGHLWHVGSYNPWTHQAK